MGPANLLFSQSTRHDRENPGAKAQPRMSYLDVEDDTTGQAPYITHRNVLVSTDPLQKPLSTSQGIPSWTSGSLAFS